MSTFFVHVRTWECIRSGVLGKERSPVKHVHDGMVRGQKEMKFNKFTVVYIYNLHKIGWKFLVGFLSSCTLSIA